MIERQQVEQALQRALEGVEGAFPVEVTVTPADDIIVTLDTLSPAGIDIDTCAAISRAISAELEAADPEADFSLEVGSAGLTAPFTVYGQYAKNIGAEVEVVTKDGRKLKGVLKSAEQAPDGSTVSATITVNRRVKPEGAKRPVMQAEDLTLVPATDIKRISALISF